MAPWKTKEEHTSRSVERCALLSTFGRPSKSVMTADDWNSKMEAISAWGRGVVRGAKHLDCRIGFK